MKRHLLPLLLAAGLLLSTPALAAADSMENFTRGRTYAGQFSDLTEDSTFYGNVSALYEYGLSNGRPDGTYGLQAPMTRGEIFIFAGRIRSLYRTGDPEAGPETCESEDGSLSGKYLAYLRAEGVAGEAAEAQSGGLSVPASRAEVAHVLASVLPKEELPLINDQAVTEGYASGEFLTDVTAATPYREDILFLYRAGISGGSDQTGSFRPGDPVSRGAAAAMLTRVVDPALRITLDWTVSGAETSQEPTEKPDGNSAGALRDVTYGSLVEPGTYIAAPTTSKELEGDVRYMLASDSNQLSLRYDSLSAVQARAVMNIALRAVKIYCEQGYNSVSCTYVEAGEITLTFSASQVSTEQVREYRQIALDAALAARQELYETGRLTEDMTEKEKAAVYFAWICDNCVYDAGAGDGSLSHIPYNLFQNGTAVCDGYTGAYNLFLKLEGIECMALSNDSHIWTVAELDGNLVHIDTTWGDTGTQPNYAYFAMSPEEAWREHPW